MTVYQTETDTAKTATEANAGKYPGRVILSCDGFRQFETVKAAVRALGITAENLGTYALRLDLGTEERARSFVYLLHAAGANGVTRI